MPRKKNVCFLGNQLVSGGGAQSLYLMIKSLINIPIEKFLFLSEIRSEEMKNELARHTANIELLPLEQIKSCQTSTTAEKLLDKIKKGNKQKISKFIDSLNRNEIDILHVNNAVFPDVIEEVKKRTDVKIVQHVRELLLHSGQSTVADYIINSILVNCDAIISISDNEIIPFINHKNTFVIENPFDFGDIFKLNKDYNIRNIHGIEDDTVLVGMSARFTKNKGHIDFLKALRTLEQLKPQVKYKFVIVGIPQKRKNLKQVIKRIIKGKSYYDEMLSFIRKNHLSDNLILIRYTDKILEILADLDIIVRPSLNGDPWGRDIIEAYALKKPVIAYGDSGFYIKENISGNLINTGDFEKMAQAIHILIGNKELRQAYGQNGFKIIKNKCDLNDYGDKIMKVYASVL